MQSMLRCFPHVDKELKRTGVNRQMLWEAYYKEFPDGYQYSQLEGQGKPDHAHGSQGR
jgi:hypothetical protein